MINEKIFYNEMLVHTALSVHPEAKKVLVLGHNKEVLNEISKHKISADFCENDFITFATQAKNSVYDVILLDSEFSDQKDEFSSSFYAQIARILKDKGIFVTPGANPYLNLNSSYEAIKKLSNLFYIVMPFRCDMPSKTGGSLYFNFASKKYHPTADIILQKADLIDGLKYYSSDIHISSFALPPFIDKELRGAIKK
jgi:spermidine synthase